ncbi:hypothetical protein ACWDV4_10790 [Micromonospora sp. NPDC003197]
MKTWCGANGEILTLNEDGTFMVDRLSERYTNDILHDDHYIEGYRLRTEFGGVLPDSAAGSWELVIAGNDYFSSHESRVELSFPEFGSQASAEYNDLFFEYDESGQLILVVHRTDPPRYDPLFASCPSPSVRQT